MAPPQPRKGPVRVPQNPLTGGARSPNQGPVLPWPQVGGPADEYNRYAASYGQPPFRSPDTGQNPLMGGALPQVPRERFGAMPNGQMVPKEVLSPAQQADWSRAMRESSGGSPPASPLANGLPQVPRAQFGAMPGGQMIPREPMNPAQQSDWARAMREASGRSQGGVPQSPLGPMPAGLMQSGGPAQLSSGFAGTLSGVGGGMSALGAAAGLMSGVGRANTVMADSVPDSQLAYRMNQLTQRSQAQNPLTPQQTPIGETLDAIATRNAQLPNFRTGDFSQSAGQQYSNSLSLRPDDMRDRLASRDAALQPGGVQMQRRFAPASPLGQEADYYRRGQQGVDAGEGVFIQPGGYGSPQQYLGFNNTREGAEQTAIAMAERRATDRTAPGFRSEEQRAAQLQQGLDRRKAAIASGLPKRRAEEKKAALQDRTLKRAVMRGMNPLSPQAQALYPEAVGRLRAARSGGQAAPANPLNPANPLATGPGGKVTAQDKANARTIARGLVQGIPGPPDKDGNPTPGTDGNPFLQQIKVTGDLDTEQDIGSLHRGMVANLESSNPVTPSVEDLRAVQSYMNSIKTEHGDDATKLPQTFIKSPPIAMFQHRWDELAKMPANASDKELMDWYAKFASTDRRGMSIF